MKTCAKHPEANRVEINEGHPSGRCQECRRERDRKRHAAHPEKKRERDRERYAANPEKKREKARKWTAANPEKKRESIRKWDAAHPEKKREQARKRYAANPEKKLESRSRYLEDLKWSKKHATTTRLGPPIATESILEAVNEPDRKI